MTADTLTLIAGTVAATVACGLLFLRWERAGVKPGLALAQKWSSVKASTATVLIVGLLALPVLSFFDSAYRLNPTGTPAVETARLQNPLEAANKTDTGNDADPNRALDAVRSYLGSVAQNVQNPSNMSTAAAGEASEEKAALPDVDTMIARLASRLESAPDDAEGWKMLGWSYSNTGKTDLAVKAYEKALALRPGDAELTAALETAKKKPADTQAPGTPAAAAASGNEPSSEAVKAAADLAPADRDQMINGMVEKLAARLETSPRDEEGWIKLMRSHMVLGDKERAKGALSKALQAFSAEADVKDRLAKAASELGVDTN